MSEVLSKEECLQLDIETYNKAMELQWKKDKVRMNLSGDLSDCKYCGRKWAICCICPEAEKKWNDMLKEVQEVAGRDRSGES